MPAKEERTTVNGQRAEAAERMLERKRLGLESAIEALETVGYRVVQDERGQYNVFPPRPIWQTLGSDALDEDDEPASVLLDGYPVLLTIKEAAEILGVSGRTVSRLCAKGEIDSFKIGRSIRINKNVLAAYMS